MLKREIRAYYDETTITVYQAYNSIIAKSAIKEQTFVSPPFKVRRMTWIKPSFLWMMYRSGWATKENQEHILSIQMKREGFEWALSHSCLSHFDQSIYGSHDNWIKVKEKSPVRIQWDPERNIKLEPLNHRAIQIGLSEIAVEQYISNWIVSIEDITPFCKKIKSMIDQKSSVIDLLPEEKLYPLPLKVSGIINLSS